MVEKGADLGINSKPPTPSANKFSYYRRNGYFCILGSDGIEIPLQKILDSSSFIHGKFLDVLNLNTPLLGAGYSQNLLQYSEVYSNIIWTKDASLAITDNTISVVDPIGKTTASLLQNGISAYSGLSQTVNTPGSSGWYCFSTWIYNFNNCPNIRITFTSNLGNQNKIIELLPGWNRIYSNIDYGAFVPTFIQVKVDVYNNGQAVLWGSQLEKSEYPSIYSQTLATPASVSSVVNYFKSAFSFLDTLLVKGAATFQDRILTTNIHNNQSTLANQGITSGTYTPVFSNYVQFTAASVIPQGTFKFIRIGQIVKVSGRVNFTTKGSNTVLNSCRMTLPIIPSINFTTVQQVNGIGNSKLNVVSAARPIHVEAVVGATTALLAVYSAGNGTANQYNIELTYEMF